LRDIPNIIVQKIPGPECTITLKMNFSQLLKGQKFGFMVLGLDYSSLIIEHSDTSFCLYQTIDHEGEDLRSERIEDRVSLSGSALYLKLAIADSAVCRFYYSVNGSNFHEIGKAFKAREGRWIGARIGMTCMCAKSPMQGNGFVDVDWIRFH
jgi:hypothetical protein